MLKNCTIIIILNLLLILVSCSSAPKERKPFMIIGKVEQPIHSVAAWTLGYDLGGINMKGNELKTKYSNFTILNFSTSLSVGAWKGGWAFGCGGTYLFNSYDKSSTDSSGKSIKLESFNSHTFRGFFSTYTHLLSFERATIGFSLVYYPFLKSNFYNVSTLSSNKANLNGSGYGATLNINTWPLGIGLSYKKVIYKQDLVEDQFLLEFGGGIGFRLF